MANISKHEAKQERERDNIEGGGIDFFVVRSAVCDHDFMERPYEIIHFEESGRSQSMVLDLYNLRTPEFVSVSELWSHLLGVFSRHPIQSDKQTAVQFALVHR